MWLGDSQYRLAGSLLTLIGQLVAAFPDQEWQTSGGTGTIGDAAHRAEGSASDHNPWLNNTVRALDVAKTANGPDCESLFRMVNAMYGAKDPRVFPYGYAIFNGRITDWDNPGGFHAQVGDQHLTHCHISVGQSGYNATNPWPITAPTGELTMDAEATAAFAALNNRLTALFAVDTTGDGKPDVTGTVQGADRYALADVLASVQATQQMVAALPARLASLQAAVAALSPTLAKVQSAVAAIKPGEVVLDTAAIVTGVVGGVASKIQGFTFKAQP